MRIAVLHPGAMGSSVAAALGEAGHEVYWLPDGRSEATHARAQDINVRPLKGRSQLVGLDAVVSVCPPDAARQLAAEVIATGFKGTLVDANAVAPVTTLAIAEQAGQSGVGFVDGGIIGPPTWRRGGTRLYLSGPDAEAVAAWFRGSALEAHAIGAEPGAASGLKMCYAAYTKGSSALLLAVRALAEALGVGDALLAEWELSQPDLPARVETTARMIGPKGWRFVGEMLEIAATFEGQGMDGGFHRGAANLYGRLARFKDRPVDLDALIRALLDPDEAR